MLSRTMYGLQDKIVSVATRITSVKLRKKYMRDVANTDVPLETKNTLRVYMNTSQTVVMANSS